MSKSREIADSTKTLAVDGGTIKLDGNYPVATNNVALGNAAGSALSTGGFNTFLGSLAGDAADTSNSNTAVGYSALSAETKGENSVAIGDNALKVQNFTVSTDAYNVAIGAGAGRAVSTGTKNTLMGSRSGDALTEAGSNVAIGESALSSDTLGSRSVAIGDSALYAQNFTSATDAYNVAVGFSAGNAVSTGTENTFIGGLAGDAITTSNSNVALGKSALSAETTSNGNTAIGAEALRDQNVGGVGDARNTAVGLLAGANVSTGVSNTFLGALAGQANTTGFDNVAVGYQAGYSNVDSAYNTSLGDNAGYFNTSTRNTYLGHGSGEAMTTGSRNTILGRYSGNQGGLDMRTLSNHIVLSDGDGNPRVLVDSSGNVMFGTTTSNLSNVTTGTGLSYRNGIALDIARENAGTGQPCINLNLTGVNGESIIFYKDGVSVGSVSVTGSATAYNTSSDYRLKEAWLPMAGASARVQSLKPINFAWKIDSTRVDGFLAHELAEVVPEAVTGSKDAMKDEEYEVTPAVYENVIIPAIEAVAEVPAVYDAEGVLVSEMVPAVEAEAERTEQRLVTEAVMGIRSVPDMQAIDQSKIVPLLTASLQEALTKIDALEAKQLVLEANQAVLEANEVAIEARLAILEAV
tara:strand:- start:5090 stop:6997 length:1908 start_codon:yes stop_codon:yes gene_type:complete